MAKNKGGRPPFTEAQVADMKAVYLELLAKGKNEREIDCVDGMATWFTRYEWKKDPEFSTQCKMAKAHGAESDLLKAEMKLEETITRAEDEACPPQLPPLVKELLSHARWKAKCFNKDYADKQIHVGDADNPVKIDTKVEVVHVHPK